MVEGTFERAAPDFARQLPEKVELGAPEPPGRPDVRSIRRRPRRRARLGVHGAALALAVIAAVVTGTALLPTGAGGSAHEYYLAIGASETLGYQPTSGGLQVPTRQGYVHDIAEMERARWPGLRVVRIACAGIRMELALAGGGNCDRPAGSEVATAAAFLRAHRGQVVLVTMDLGFPDMGSCLLGRVVYSECVEEVLSRVRALVPIMVSRLRAAGGPSLRIVGLDHDDPFLAAYVDRSSPDPTFATESVHVVERLNLALTAVYENLGVKVAHVGSAFSTGVTKPAYFRGRRTVPFDVKQICRLTWTCTDQNPHPNPQGYETIASAVAASIAS